MLFVLGHGDGRQEHAVIGMVRGHHPAQQPVPLHGFQDIQHPGRPSGSGMGCVRRDHVQRHFVRLVLRAIDEGRLFCSIRLFGDLQGQGVGYGDNAGEMVGQVVVFDDDVGGRRVGRMVSPPRRRSLHRHVCEPLPKSKIWTVHHCYQSSNDDELLAIMDSIN